MKKIFITNNVALSMDADIQNVRALKSQREAVSRIYKVDEDCVIQAQYGDNVVEKEAKAGDIIVTFYEQEFPNRVIVLSNNEWRENLDHYNAAMQEAERKLKENSCERYKPCDLPESVK